MQSGNYLFSLPLFKKNVARFWPLWGLYTLVLFLMLPFYFLMQNHSWAYEPLAELFQSYVMQLACNPFLTVVYAVPVAMALWSYLYNSRSAGAIHALPLRRETIFFTNYITGLLFFLVPTLCMVLLGLCCQSIVGAVTANALMTFLLTQSLMMVFFFSFATLLAFVTGNILALPAFYIIFNGLFIGLSRLFDEVFRQFVYGYDMSPVLDWVGWHFSPLFWIIFEIRPHTNPNGFAVDGIYGMEAFYLYAVAGLIMAGLALLLYRRRKLEAAGELIAVSWLRPVFKYGIGLCGALAFGVLSYSVFALRGNMPTGFWTMLLFLILWGVIFYLATAMLISKSFRVFGKEKLGCGILALALILCMGAMEIDVFGVEKRVPDPSQVQSARINAAAMHSSEFLQYDPEFIAAVTEFHKVAAGGKDEVSYWFANNPNLNYDPAYPEAEFFWEWIDINYQLKHGGILQRSYQIPVSRELLADENSLAYAYDALINDPVFAAENAFPSEYTREMLYQAEFASSVGLEVLGELRAQSQIPWSVNGGNYYFSREEALRLYDAVQEDLQAGRMGRQYLLWSEECANTFAGDLNFYFQMPNRQVTNVRVTLAVESSATLAVLEELGFRRGVDLYTWEEYDALSNAYYGDGLKDKPVFAPTEEVWTEPAPTLPEAAPE